MEQQTADEGGCPECGDWFIVRNTRTKEQRCRNCGHQWGGQ